MTWFLPNEEFYKFTASKTAVTIAWRLRNHNPTGNITFRDGKVRLNCLRIISCVYLHVCDRGLSGLLAQHLVLSSETRYMTLLQDNVLTWQYLTCSCFILMHWIIQLRGGSRETRRSEHRGLVQLYQWLDNKAGQADFIFARPFHLEFLSKQI